MFNRIEKAAAAADAITPLEVQAPGLPVACLFATIVRAIAGQAELAQAAKFAAQRQNFYKAFANDAVRGPGFTTAPSAGAGVNPAGLSSDELLAVVA